MKLIIKKNNINTKKIRYKLRVNGNLIIKYKSQLRPISVARQFIPSVKLNAFNNTIKQNVGNKNFTNKLFGK
tara:strand:- start:225 stop:440 length:216 start_codon:yes stop_codon:yes gene_type:complete